MCVLFSVRKTHPSAGLLIGMVIGMVCLTLSACGQTQPNEPDATLADGAPDVLVDQRADSGSPCDVLFGTPNANTGLSAEQCRPVCECGGARFEARSWSATDFASLRAFVMSPEFPQLSADPYDSPAASVGNEVCAVIVDDQTSRRYHVETFTSAEAATTANATITHNGPCGVCSTLTDLAVYAETPDLTAPVRSCGLSNLNNFAGLVTCLEGLGFTLPCAQVWAYNTVHTREACGSICLSLLRAPYHNADGTLNACLACDERESGEVFKAVAGRTRRNSGLANAMCRPCDEVVRINHPYVDL